MSATSHSRRDLLATSAAVGAANVLSAQIGAVADGNSIQPFKRAIRGTRYDGRNAAAKLNAPPQFVTTIDGLDIHFNHARSRYLDAIKEISQ
jgi:hypothetical protein